MLEFSGKDYEEIVAELFVRFPSFQKVGAGAYKPGIDRMREFDSLLGRPHRRYPCVHVAGTNGKGSVSSMLASVCAAAGLRTGLYTSPHIEDFRERMRIVDGSGVRYIGKGAVLRFLRRWRVEMDRLDLSFFEITTAMAFSWFEAEKVDVAIIETGLGGRLDSTNIITPVLSVVTNIGFDHCDMLGNTLSLIAGEKAGIFKRGVPAVVGESGPETDPVFEAKAREINVQSLTFADKVEPKLWWRRDEILEYMDLQGSYQQKNLRTALAATDRLELLAGVDENVIVEGIEHTASRTDFHGRWEKVSDIPYIIADIGHNSHGLRGNFAQLETMMRSGRFSSLRIVYATMTDKDVDEIMKLFPREAEVWFVTVSNKRAMPAQEIMNHYLAAGLDPGHAHCSSLPAALAEAASDERSLVYIGGSAYLVSEALPLIKKK
ncbi:MAG: bifunctional folylpolyglutamate synthase/dihydrofolate synthase [Bacteroidales bacterium]|nr:bifunctional folylpolyglutamate synthase/dihydrofolate synthase [Bacteroidales bacterium]